MMVNGDVECTGILLSQNSSSIHQETCKLLFNVIDLDRRSVPWYFRVILKRMTEYPTLAGVVFLSHVRSWSVRQE
jgi:hypothetical protein